MHPTHIPFLPTSILSMAPGIRWMIMRGLRMPPPRPTQFMECRFGKVVGAERKRYAVPSLRPP